MIIRSLENGVEVAPYWNVNFEEKLLENFDFWVEVAPYWNVNVAVVCRLKLQ